MRAYLWPKTKRLPAVTTRRLKESFHSFRKEPGSVWKGKVSRLSRRFREREAQLINLSAAFQQRYLLKPFCAWLRLSPPSCIQAIAAPDYHRNSAERQPCPQGRPSAPRRDAAARRGPPHSSTPRPQPRLPQRGEPPAGCSPRGSAARRAPRPPPSAGATCTPRPPRPPPAACAARCPHRGSPADAARGPPPGNKGPEPTRGSALATAGDSGRGASGTEFRTATFVPSPGSGENAKGAPNRCLTSPSKESRS